MLPQNTAEAGNIPKPSTPQPSLNKDMFFLFLGVLSVFIIAFIFFIWSFWPKDVPPDGPIGSGTSIIKYKLFTNSASVPDTDFVLFNGYEVPTNNASESEIYLPMWKQAFQKINGISDEYFNSHIIIAGSEATEHSKGAVFSKAGKTFYVRYWWQFDWAKANLTDYFDYYVEGIGTITPDKLLPEAGPSFKKTNEFPQNVWISRVSPITRIITKDQIENTIRELVSVNAEYSINLGRNIEPIGKPIVDVYGTINDTKNECVNAKILLETADVLSVDNVACRIY